jgi:hypothetical protein
MTILERTLPAEAMAGSAPEFGLRRRIASLCVRITTWMEARADRYAAAAIYDQLSRLSDAELQRRGLSRETLVHDIGEASDAATRRRIGGLRNASSHQS